MGTFLILLTGLLISANLIIILCQGIYNFIDTIKLTKRRNELGKEMEDLLGKIEEDIRDIKNKEE